MKLKFKNNKAFIGSIKVFSKKLFFLFAVFYYRIRKSIILMSKFEKNLTIFFSFLFFSLVVAKINTVYMENTKPVPGYGGKYQEAVFGDLKYINPVLASSETDKSTSKLIFSSLIKIDKSNNVLPEIASSWETSTDGLKYSFTLKDNVRFQDGEPLTANDVVFTVNQMKNPDLKSPSYDKWKDVSAEVDENGRVIFTLPKAYGPFIYNCDFGIIPSHLDFDLISQTFIGSGPYKFIKTEKAQDGVGTRISKLNLESNSDYYSGAPFIKNIQIDYFTDEKSAQKDFSSNKTLALSGLALVDSDDVNNYSFETSKRLALIFNLRDEKLKTKEVRERIAKNQKSESTLDLSLVTLDNPIQKQKAEEIKNNLTPNNINVSIRYLSAIELKDALSKKDFELLLYGFDFGHDRDPYGFWHSSQINKNNFAGFADKNSDILLEDARMTLDPVERNKKYDQFMQTVQNEYLAAFYDPIQYQYYVKKDVLGIPEMIYSDVASKYLGIEKWYIKMGRVKK